MTDNPANLMWRTRQHFVRKVLLFCVLPPLFTAFYYAPQWFAVFPPRQLPLLWIDRVVPFHTLWIWPYMSMYLMLPLAPMLATRLEHLRRYSIGMGVMFVSCCIFFVLLPIGYPRPPVPAGSSWLYRSIVWMDDPINAIPSLHAGLCIYTMLFAWRALRDLPPRTYRTLMNIGWIWTAFILYGTLATKQHYFVDLPAGALVAWAAHIIAWRARYSANNPTSCEGDRDATQVMAN